MTVRERLNALADEKNAESITNKTMIPESIHGSNIYHSNDRNITIIYYIRKREKYNS